MKVAQAGAGKKYKKATREEADGYMAEAKDLAAQVEQVIGKGLGF